MPKKGRHNQKEVKNPILIQINRIIEEREGGSVADFCSKIGVKPDNYYMWVARDGTPRQEIIQRVCDIYGVSVGWFYGGAEHENKKKEGGVADVGKMVADNFHLIVQGLCDGADIDLEKVDSDLLLGGALIGLRKERRLPDNDTVAKIANYFGVELASFFRRGHESPYDRAARGAFGVSGVAADNDGSVSGRISVVGTIDASELFSMMRRIEEDSAEKTAVIKMVMGGIIGKREDAHGEPIDLSEADGKSKSA